MAHSGNTKIWMQNYEIEVSEEKRKEIICPYCNILLTMTAKLNLGEITGHAVARQRVLIQ